MSKKTKKKIIAIAVFLLTVVLSVGFILLKGKNDKSIRDESDAKPEIVTEMQNEIIDGNNNLTPCITDKSGSGGSEEDLIKPASGTTAEPEKDVVTQAPSVTQTAESNKSDDKEDEIALSEQDVITSEVIASRTEDDNKKAADKTEKTNTPIPTVKVNTPIPSTLAVTPIPTVKSVSPTPTDKPRTPTPTTKVNTPVPTEKVSIPTQKINTPVPTVKINTPMPTSTVHVCSSFEQISKTVTVPMQIVEVDRGAYDEEIVTDQVYWCMSCGKSEYDLGFRTYNMETGETIWEDYNGFCEHCEYCWIKTGKGGNWNDFKQQVINVVHHDHCYGKDVIPEHEEVVNGKKCTICGKEYW